MLLYKILTVGQWESSQGKKYLELGAFDHNFIHLAEEDNKERICKKFFPGQEVVILSLETEKLEGNLIKEVNPGGARAYYHLYNGNIPLVAVAHVERRHIEQD